MKLTRRKLIPALTLGAAAASALAANASAQSAAGTAAADPARTAHDAVQRNMDTLAKFEVPMAIEPSFQFKA